MAERSRSFLPVVGVGVVSAVLSAVVGHHPWAKGSAGSTAGFSSLDSAAESGRVPGATALALVLLACWGVVLVTRGRVRQVVAALGVLAGAGLVVAVVLGFGTAPDAVRGAYDQFGVEHVDVARTAWFWLAGPVALVS
ncbi:MAG: hypothetical protein JWM47_4174, partial [Acidimicrobiales bacterium]|nr:hypothetical protein [Acidimicrobiales bacterium]